ncbi:choline dehydrogenase-like flavoprotein [Leifsonia sp. EB41]|uniref:GMC oxidoreductase n=1 Tax=Leifsonia sp. EB41 TaxID=3156260 RepID=UPI003519C464
MTIAGTSAASHLTVSFDTACSRRYDYVVLGGGGTAAAFIAGVVARRPAARILVLEQGAFLLSSHAQNLGVAFQPLMSTAAASPWRSEGDLDLVSQVPFLGGRTLVWSGSVPQPSRDHLRRWPASIVDSLDDHWGQARSWLGARSATSIAAEYGGLHAQLRDRAFDVVRRDPRLQTAGRPEEFDAPLAHPEDASGVTVKFSAIAPLLRAASEAPGFDIVTECLVERLVERHGAVTEVCTSLGTLEVGDATVVLALGTSEATGLVLRSCATVDAPNAGRNLAANSASFFTCRVPRSAFAELSTRGPELAALYIDGRTERREFHLHLSAVATTDRNRDIERVYRLMPDMFGNGTPELVCDEDHVVLIVHGLAEIAGRGVAPDASRIDVDHDVTIGRFVLDEADHEAWDSLDDCADRILEGVSGGAAVEYWSAASRSWLPHLEVRRMPFAFHETGTLWMGDEASGAVTDEDGRLRGASNVFVLGGATFPTRGSWNPFLTMVALSRRLADTLEQSRAARR